MSRPTVRQQRDQDELVQIIGGWFTEYEQDQARLEDEDGERDEDDRMAERL